MLNLVHASLSAPRNLQALRWMVSNFISTVFGAPCHRGPQYSMTDLTFVLYNVASPAASRSLLALRRTPRLRPAVLATLSTWMSQSRFLEMWTPNSLMDSAGSKVSEQKQTSELSVDNFRLICSNCVFLALNFTSHLLAQISISFKSVMSFLSLLSHLYVYCVSYANITVC